MQQRMKMSLMCKRKKLIYQFEDSSIDNFRKKPLDFGKDSERSIKS